MQSLLNIKVFTDFNTGTRRLVVRRGICGGGLFGESEVGVIRRQHHHHQQQWFNSRYSSTNSRILACANNGNGNGSGQTPSPIPSSSSSSSSSSFFSRSQTYALLKQRLEVAAKSEDYEEAARIRDSLKSFEEEEPVLRLRRLMKKAVAEERFEDAAKFRDELKEIAPHALLKCSSDATTLICAPECWQKKKRNGLWYLDIQVFLDYLSDWVQVRSVYIEGRSQPSRGQYFFAYRIRITNNSDRPIQLLRRHWIITDANEKIENVWGTGVIGEQPVILPHTGFEYSSACPLSTPNGRMEGDFEMKHIDRVGSQSFNVAIAPFSLSILGDDTDSF